MSLDMKKSDMHIFNLEQEFMDCWGVVDDIDMLYKYFGDDEFFIGMKGEHADKIMNLMGGIHAMYQLKFERTWGTFEKVCAEYHKRGRAMDKILGDCSPVEEKT
tara:strand:- start:493 stop:804 length:312 start_codon:yes stop_codon:yes gene_type:complete